MKTLYAFILLLLMLIGGWICWEFTIFETIPIIGFQCPYGHNSLVAKAIHRGDIGDPYERKYLISCTKCGYGLDLREINNTTRYVWARFTNQLSSFEIPIDPLLTDFPLEKLNSSDSLFTHYFQQIHGDSVVVEGLYCKSRLPSDSIKTIITDYLKLQNINLPPNWEKAVALESIDIRFRNWRIKVALHEGNIGEYMIRFNYSKLDDLFF